MILIAFAGIVGGVCSFATLLPFGWPAAVLGAPFAGSLSALVVACFVGYRRTLPALRAETGIADPVRRLDGDARPA